MEGPCGTAVPTSFLSVTAAFRVNRIIRVGEPGVCVSEEIEMPGLGREPSLSADLRRVPSGMQRKAGAKLDSLHTLKPIAFCRADLWRGIDRCAQAHQQIRMARAPFQGKHPCCETCDSHKARRHAPCPSSREVVCQQSGLGTASAVKPETSGFFCRHFLQYVRKSRLADSTIGVHYS